MSKTLFILQPYFIGDLLFCQKIAKVYSGFGYKVIWPVLKEYKWVVDNHIINNDPNILYPTFEDNFQYKDIFMKMTDRAYAGDIAFKQMYHYNSYFSFLALERSWTLNNTLPLMSGKYTMSGVPDNYWPRYVDLQRNYSKEDELMTTLGLDEYSKYILVNESCSTKKVKIELTDIPSNHYLVYMNPIEGFGLFDWLKVIEYANGLVTIDTVLVLLVEILKKKSKAYSEKPLHVCNRYTLGVDNHLTSYAIGDIVETDWKFHDEQTDHFKIGKL